MLDNELLKFIPNVEFRCIPCNMLRTDIAYQRERSAKFVRKVASDFNKNLLKVVRVSDRDGQYWVWDGQHTIDIVKEVSERQDVPVWCMVYKGLSYEDEAYLFSKQQQYEKALLSVNITNAKIEAKDPDALMIERILASYGFSISEKLGDYRIKATKAIEVIYTKYGPDCLSRVLLLIRDTWNGKKEYIRSAFITALAKLLILYGEQIKDDAFVSRFKNTTYDEIVFEANNCGYGQKKDYLRALVIIYNRRGGKRLNLEVLSTNI